MNKTTKFTLTHIKRIMAAEQHTRTRRWFKVLLEFSILSAYVLLACDDIVTIIGIFDDM